VTQGERIVTDGLDKLQAGTKVSVQMTAKQEALKQAAAKATVQRNPQ